MFRSGKTAKARKIGASLFAAYPDASPPLVWKFDLEKNHSFTLALQGEDGDWELGVTSPRGEFYTVARFLTRDDAEDAFIRTQRALIKKPCKPWGVLIGSAVTLLVLLIAAFFLSNMHSAPSKTATLDIPGNMMMPGNPGKIKEGVPLNADQVLMPPP